MLTKFHSLLNYSVSLAETFIHTSFKIIKKIATDNYKSHSSITILFHFPELTLTSLKVVN